MNYLFFLHIQIVQKDPEAAILLFWKAINAGDRVDSALKDMAVVMKQQDRAEEAIEAIKSFRDRCSKQAQESLDNVLIDLYKVKKRFGFCAFGIPLNHLTQKRFRTSYFQNCV